MFPVVMGHIPGGCNIRQPLHYIQLQNSDRFCQYDYDPKEILNECRLLQLTPLITLNFDHIVRKHF